MNIDIKSDFNGKISAAGIVLLYNKKVRQVRQIIHDLPNYIKPFKFFVIIIALWLFLIIYLIFNFIKLLNIIFSEPCHYNSSYIT